MFSFFFACIILKRRGIQNYEAIFFIQANRDKLQKKYKIIHKNLYISCRIIFHVFINQTRVFKFFFFLHP